MKGGDDVEQDLCRVPTSRLVVRRWYRMVSWVDDDIQGLSAVLKPMEGTHKWRISGLLDGSYTGDVSIAALP